LKDWIDDLDATKTNPFSYCTSCEVHKGFWDSYMALKPQIEAALAGLGAGSGTSIAITGHSLGAAMAALAAFDLHHAGFQIQTMYTFGEPRVGDSTFASTFESALPGVLNRVTHYKDIVPHLPLELMGFHHLATEVWYNEANTAYTVCDGSGEDPNCADSVIGDSIDDHLYYMGIHISGICSAADVQIAPGLRGAVNAVHE
jgi:hypothetical protein